MRDLRQRLMAIAKNSEAKRPESPPEVKAGETFFCREGIVPRAMLGDIDSVTLNDVCTCDPYFSGKSWHTERLLFLDTETTGLSGGAGTSTGYDSQTIGVTAEAVDREILYLLRGLGVEDY